MKSWERVIRRRSRDSGAPAAACRGTSGYAAEPLEPRTLLTTIQIQGPGFYNDQIRLSSHTDRTGIRMFVDWSINGGPTQSAGVFPIDNVLVTDPGHAFTVNVISTVISTTLQADLPNSGPESIVNLGGGPNGMQGIFGQVNITNPNGGFWQMNADDSAGTTARTAPLAAPLDFSGGAAGTMTGLAPALIRWTTYVGILHIDTSSAGGNAINIPGVYQLVQTTIRGHSMGADDVLNIGSDASGGLADIRSAITIASPGPGPTGLWNLTVDDRGEPTQAPLTLDDGTLTEASNANVKWDSSVVQQVTVETSATSMADVSINNTDVPVMLIGGYAQDSLLVGNGSTGTQGILGNVTVSSNGGYWYMNAYDVPDNKPRNVTLHTIRLPPDPYEYSAIDGEAPATIAFRQGSVAGLTIQLGTSPINATVTMNVLATIVDTGISSAGPLRLNLGDNGTVQNIHGYFSIFPGSTGPLPPTFITIDDSADPIARQATFTATPAQPQFSPIYLLTGLAPARMSFLPDAVNSHITIDGGTGGNTFTVNGSYVAASPQSSFVLNAGTGNDTVNVNGSGVDAALTVNGQDGNDSVIVNYSGGNVDPYLTVNGNGGFNTLTIVGGGPNSMFALAPGSITFGSIVTHYSAFASLALEAGAFTVGADLAGVQLATLGTGTTVTFTTTQHLSSVSIGAGSQATLASGAVPLSSTLFCTALSIASGGKLDLANNALQLTYIAAAADPIAAIRAYLASGYNAGAWNGAGIITSMGDAAHALGFGDSADGIVPGLAANALLVRFTRYGDVNLDGSVSLADVLALAHNYGRSGVNWDQGDMSFDGVVRFNDLMTIARNYGATAAAAVRPAIAMRIHTRLDRPIRHRQRRHA